MLFCNDSINKSYSDVIGKQLLKAAEEWSRQKSCIGMRLNSGSSRLDAHGFYRSQGYSSEKTQVRFLKMYDEG